MKFKRNGLCPCGSGKKHKQCCLKILTECKVIHRVGDYVHISIPFPEDVIAVDEQGCNALNKGPAMDQPEDYINNNYDGCLITKPDYSQKH